MELRYKFPLIMIHPKPNFCNTQCLLVRM